MSLDIDLIQEVTERKCVHWQNITHNLAAMACEAGIYGLLWNPREGQKAKEMIAPLRRAIKEMERDPERFKKHNAENGWGTYDIFVPGLNELLEACMQFPEAEIRISK